jgi:L-alanine-DL-glutamate epimerase-like enolase superfamily enzyme
MPARGSGSLLVEEPLPAEDLGGHRLLAAATSVPVAVGESIYSPSHFREYLAAGAAGILQGRRGQDRRDHALAEDRPPRRGLQRQGGAALLDELHVRLAAAVPNSLYVEYIPQLRSIMLAEMEFADGCAIPPSAPGIGLEWDRERVAGLLLNV